MKVAILYSGAIRHLAETLRNNLMDFDYYDSEIDLYFSTWDHMGYADRINSPDYITYPRVLPPDTKVTNQLIEDIVGYTLHPFTMPAGAYKRKAKIKAINIEKYVPNSYKFDILNGTDNNGLSAQYYKIWDCFTLLDNDINYDLLVRCRGDFTIHRNNKTYLADMVANNKIVFPSKIWYNHSFNSESRAINEMMWVSNKELMKKACSIYNNVDKMNAIIQSRNQKETNYGESICFLNLEAENMLDNICTFDFDYTIYR